jgi:hypothetical protein
MFGSIAFEMRLPKSGGSIEFKTRVGTYGQVAFEMRHGMSKLGYIYLDGSKIESSINLLGSVGYVGNSSQYY